MARRFRFRTIPFIATVLLVALGLSLGQWQTRRAAGKLALQAQLDERGRAAPLTLGATLVPAASVEFRPVSVTGQFISGWPLYLENRPLKGRVGSYVLMPLRIANSNTHVLVARGWVPRNSLERTRIPDYATPSGSVTVTGVAREQIGRLMQLGEPPAVKPGAMVQNVTVAEFAAASGLTLQPFFIAQSAPVDPSDTLEREWPAPALGVDKHQGYAFQWYGLSLMALLFFVITGFKRSNDRADDDREPTDQPPS